MARWITSPIQIQKTLTEALHPARYTIADSKIRAPEPGVKLWVTWMRMQVTQSGDSDLTPKALSRIGGVRSPVDQTHRR